MVTSHIVNSAVNTDGTASTVPLTPPNMTPAEAIVVALRPQAAKPPSYSGLPDAITDDTSFAIYDAYYREQTGKADSLEAEATTLSRRSSIAYFYSGLALGMIRDFLKAKKHGEWKAWLDANNIAESTARDCCQFYASAIKKWETPEECEKQLSQMTRTCAKNVLYEPPEKSKRKWTGPNPANVGATGRNAPLIESTTEDKKKPIVEIPPPEPVIVDHQDIGPPDTITGTVLPLAILMNYVDDDEADPAIYGLMQINQLMDDLQPLVSRDSDRKRFGPLLGEIEAKLARLLVV